MTDQLSGLHSIPWTNTTGTFPLSRGEIDLNSVPSELTISKSSEPTGEREGRGFEVNRAGQQVEPAPFTSPTARGDDRCEGDESGPPRDLFPTPTREEIAPVAARAGSGVISAPGNARRSSVIAASVTPVY